MRIILALVIASIAITSANSVDEPLQQEFYTAIIHGRLGVVERLVEQQPDRANIVLTINKGKTLKMSALCVALQQEQKSIAEYLLSKGADPRQGPQGFPSLFYASLAGYSDMIPLLVQRGDSPNPDPEITENGPLNCAKNIETAKALIACGADVRYHNKYGDTPLHSISYFNKIDMAELFLQKGVDVNAKNKQGKTPLHEAAWECQLEMTAFLLDHGADVNACNNQNLTPLEYCVQERTDSRGVPDKSEYYKILRLLISKGARHTVEHLVRAGDLERLKTLFAEKPEEKNDKDRFGKPLLLCAIQEGQAGIVEFLLQQGADANTGGKYTPQPLHTAVYAGNPEVVKMLLKAGADIHGKGQEGESTLHWIAIRPQRETEKQEPYDQIAKMLIDAGVDINSRAKNARPDMWLVMDEPTDQIQEFLRIEEINSTSHIVQIMAPRWLAYNAGDTPLHSAARWGRTAIVRMLLDAGAKVDILNDYGQTALHYAIAAGHTEIVKILLDAGADPNATMKDGMSASQLAEKMNHQQARELLSKSKASRK